VRVARDAGRVDLRIVERLEQPFALAAGAVGLAKLDDVPAGLAGLDLHPDAGEAAMALLADADAELLAGRIEQRLADAALILPAEASEGD
jgi:hypothetical protein